MGLFTVLKTSIVIASKNTGLKQARIFIALFHSYQKNVIVSVYIAMDGFRQPSHAWLMDKVVIGRG